MSPNALPSLRGRDLTPLRVTSLSPCPQSHAPGKPRPFCCDRFTHAGHFIYRKSCNMWPFVSDLSLSKGHPRGRLCLSSLPLYGCGALSWVDTPHLPHLLVTYWAAFGRWAAPCSEDSGLSPGSPEVRYSHSSLSKDRSDLRPLLRRGEPPLSLWLIPTLG